MSRITAESIRQQMADLRSQLEHLEEFNKRGFRVEKCKHDFNEKFTHPASQHVWQEIDSEHDWRNYNSVLMECKKCGTRQWWQYKFEKVDEEDPWTDLRPEEPEEEDE